MYHKLPENNSSVRMQDLFYLLCYKMGDTESEQSLVNTFCS